MAEQERGAVVYAGKEFGEGLVRDEPLGRHRAFEEPVAVFGGLTVGRCFI
jgi:hypothetical protein